LHAFAEIIPGPARALPARVDALRIR
jgi:hypothetical protein